MGESGDNVTLPKSCLNVSNSANFAIGALRMPIGSINIQVFTYGAKLLCIS